MTPFPMMNPEQVSSYTREDFYNRPTSPDKARMAAQFLGQDVAAVARELLDDDNLFEFVRQFKG